MEFPRRPRPHQLEDRSERFFGRSLPDSWTVQRVHRDYGIDLHVDIFEQDRATGLELIVQLKAAAEPDGGEAESIRLNLSTYNFLSARLQVVLLVKYVAAEDEAYWILLRDVPPPDQLAESFTAHLPRANRLSAVQWNGITATVREVTDRKLAAQRAHMLSTQRRGI